MKLVEVLIELPSSALDRPFDYLVKDGIEVGVGFRVLVKFGSNPKPLMGFVTKVSETSLSQEELSKARGYPISYVEEVIDRERLLSEDLYALSESLSSYYLCPRIQMLQAMLPSSLKPRRSSLKGPKIAYERYVDLIRFDEEGLTPKQKEAVRLLKEAKTAKKKEAGSPSVVKSLIEKGYLRQRLVEVNRLDLGSIKPSAPLPLTSAQQSVYEAIIEGDKEVYLLQGVTGSGKTEVYLHLSSYYLSKGRNILMLVPEISLTPQLLRIFAAHFGDDIAVLHSSLRAGERYDEWKRMRDGKARIAVGPRSAVFAPLQNIGVIIIDEEHDSSYVSESNPRYDTKEVAKMRAEECGAALVLGSATPDMESYLLATEGKYKLLTLKNRIAAHQLPEMEIVDMVQEFRYGNRSLFSAALRDGIGAALERKEQVILFLNRRGFASFLMCRSCGWVAKCEDCDVSLTWHKTENVLKCHCCGKRYHMLTKCPVCGGTEIKQGKTGTEKVAEELMEQFPGVRVLRMDNDTTSRKDSYFRILSAFAAGEADVLVGTQMIAKGHDFPNVTLVGILEADAALYFSDYRSSERTFQLITQVAGRAGRADKKGRVILQTYSPRHYVFNFGRTYDYEGFWRKEINTRMVTKFPPFTKVVRVLVAAEEEQSVVECTREIYRGVRDIESRVGKFVYLGAAKSPVTRMHGLTRYQVLMRVYPDVYEKIMPEVYALTAKFRPERGSCFAETDPQSLI